MTDNHVKLIRFAVIAFSFVLVWLLFKHPPQIPDILLKAEKIDSIKIKKSDSILTVKDLVEITKFSQYFKKLVDYNPKNLRASKDITHLEIFSKEKTIDVEIFDGIDDGKVIEIGTACYKNDSLSLLVERLIAVSEKRKSKQ